VTERVCALPPQICLLEGKQDAGMAARDVRKQEAQSGTQGSAVGDPLILAGLDLGPSALLQVTLGGGCKTGATSGRQAVDSVVCTPPATVSFVGMRGSLQGTGEYLSEALIDW
jgi:hypothetical protein